MSFRITQEFTEYPLNSELFFFLNLILLNVFEFGYSENTLYLRLPGLYVFQESSPRFLGTMIPGKIL